MRTINITPLNRESFSRFGEVIDTLDAETYAINNGMAQRYHALAHSQVDTDGEVVISIVHSQPRTLPFTLEGMEYHPKGSQAFIPMQSQTMVVVVAPAGPECILDDIRAFITTPGQGINYFTGTWHHPLIVLNEACDFLVVDREGPGDNCIYHDLSETIQVHI